MISIIHIFNSLQIKHNMSSQCDTEVNLYCVPKLGGWQRWHVIYEVAIKCVCEVVYGLKSLCCLMTIHRKLSNYLVSSS